MATIYNPTQTSADPNYLQYSRGIRPNTAVGGLLGDVGTLFGQALEGYEGVQQQNIEREAFNKADAERTAQINANKALLGMETAAPNPATTTATPYAAEEGVASVISSPKVPAALQQELKDATSKLSVAGDAKLAGKMNETMYWMRQNQIASDLRARYPGQRAFIDRTFASILGTNPANKTLEETQQLIQAGIANRTSEAQRWTTWVDSHSKYFTTKAEREEAYRASGNPEQQIRIKNNIGQIQSYEHSMEVRRSELETKAKENSAKSEDGVRTAIGQSQDVFNKVWTGASLGATGMGARSISEAIVRFNASPKKDPAMLAALEGQLNIAIDAYDRNMDAELAKNYGPDKRSLAQIIGNPSKVDEIKKSQRQLLVNMRDQLRGGKFDMFSQSAAMVEAVKNNATLAVYAASPEALKHATIAQALGPGATQYLDALKQADPLKYNQTLSALAKLQLDKFALSGEGSLLELNKRADTVNPPRPGGPSEVSDQKSKVETLKKSMGDLKKLVDPKAPPEFRANGAVVLSNSENAEFINLFKKHQRVDVWANLSDKPTIDAMKTMHPEQWNRYYDWNQNTYFQLSRDYVRTIQDDGIVGDPRLNVRWDPNYLRVVYDPPKGLGSGGATRNSATIAIDRFNTMLTVRQNFLEAAGMDPKTIIPQEIVQLGYDQQKAGTLPRDSLWNFIQGVVETLKPGSTTPQIFQRKSEGASQNAPRTALEGQGEGLDFTATRVAYQPENAPAGSVGAPEGIQAIQNLIGRAEAGGNYNAIYGSTRQSQVDFTSMPVSQVMAFQKEYTDSGSPSSAVGKYQFLRKTLNGLVKEGVIDPSEPFTPEVQDRAALALMERRGLSKFLAGDMTKKQFINNLAKEWAGLPNTSGESHYAGDGLNKATVKLPAVLEAIGKLKTEDAQQALTDFSSQGRTPPEVRIRQILYDAKLSGQPPTGELAAELRRLREEIKQNKSGKSSDAGGMTDISAQSINPLRPTGR